MIRHSHPMPITGIVIPELAWASVELIQKHLRLIADQAHLLFYIANSFSCSGGRLGKPYFLNLTNSDVIFCFSKHGCKPADCPGASMWCMWPWAVSVCG